MSSRIADIIVQARLETRSFNRTLTSLRLQIENTFRGLGVSRDLGRGLQDQVRGIQQPIEETFGGYIQDQLQQTTDHMRELESGMSGVQNEVETLRGEMDKTTKKSVKGMSKAQKKAEDLMTQMRWVARDVMKIGFTAGIIGAIFIRTFSEMAKVSFDLLAVFEDLGWILEDIYNIIGEQLAPIFEMLIVPAEMIRDFLESHSAIAKLVGIVIILAAVFFSLASIVLMAAGMYAILLFGMRQFGETIRGVRSNVEDTGGTFSTISMFMKEMTKMWLRMAPAADEAGDAIAKNAKKIQGSVSEVRTAFLVMGTMRGYKGFGPEGALGKLKDWKKSGEISSDTYDIMRKETLKQMSVQDQLRYKFGEIKERLAGIRDSGKSAFSKIKSGIKGIPGMAKGAAVAGAKMVTAFASMVIIAAAMEPIMKALEPVITALSDVISSMIAPIEPLIELFAEFIENNPRLIAGILGVAIAMSVLSAASIPISVIFGAILAILFILNRIFEHFGHTLFGSGVHQAIVMVTSAMKLLLFPLYLAYKLITNFSGTIDTLRRGFSRFVDLIRGAGAWIQNIFPEPLIAVGKAIIGYLKQPIDILRGFLDVLGGIWDMLTGNWEEGKQKIINAIKSIIMKLIEIPLALVKIGWDIIKKLWEGIKKFIPWLFNKIVGGSLVWDIVSWFALLPLKLLSIGATMLVKLLEGIKNMIGELFGEDGIKGLVGDIIQFFIDIPLQIFKAGKDIIQYLIDGLLSMWETLFGGDLTDIVDEIVGFFFGIPIKILQAGKDIITKLIAGLLSLWTDLFGETGLGKIIGEFMRFFTNLALDAFQWGIDFIKSFLDGIKNSAVDIADVIDKYIIDPFRKKLEFSIPKSGALRDVPKWGEHMAQAFMGGIVSGFNMGEMSRSLGAMSGHMQSVPMRGGGNIEVNNSFVIHAQIRDQQDLINLRDEISMKQMEQARRMRVLTGGT